MPIICVLKQACYQKYGEQACCHVDKFDMNDVDLEVAEESENNQKQECDAFMFEIQEDPGMYVAAGLTPPPPTPYVPMLNGLTSKPMYPEAAIKNVMNSVADIKGSNINIKVVVVTSNGKTSIVYYRTLSFFAFS